MTRFEISKSVIFGHQAVSQADSGLFLVRQYVTRLVHVLGVNDEARLVDEAEAGLGAGGIVEDDDAADAGVLEEPARATSLLADVLTSEAAAGVAAPMGVAS